MDTIKNIFPNLDENSYEWLENKLLIEKSYVDLAMIASAVNINIYIPLLKKPKDQLSEEDFNNKAMVIELTLSYLKPLLEQGKLKMRTGEIIDNTNQQSTDEIKNNFPGISHEYNDKGLISSTKVKEYEYYDQSNAEKGIQRLISLWGNTKPEWLHSFETATHFTLPENEWKD